MKTQNGVTLVELIVALFIATLVFMGIFTTVNTAQRSSSGVEKRVAAQQDVRGALELMAMEIQMASYNPSSERDIWLDPASASCASKVPNNLVRGIPVATANAITIEMDINDSGSLLPLTSNDNPNEIISYVYDPANRYITRSTNCSGGQQAFLGDTDAHKSRKTVLVENASAGIPVFRYFNGAGTDITATVATSPTDLTLGIPAIRRIQITLVVDTADVDAGSGVRRRIVYSTSVIPRNHFAIVY
jgi:Tfp pilus assembly protein PilW